MIRDTPRIIRLALGSTGLATRGARTGTFGGTEEPRAVCIRWRCGTGVRTVEPVRTTGPPAGGGAAERNGAVPCCRAKLFAVVRRRRGSDAVARCRCCTSAYVAFQLACTDRSLGFGAGSTGDVAKNGF